jgi:Phosphotransferase enzyme family
MPVTPAGLPAELIAALAARSITLAGPLTEASSCAHLLSARSRTGERLVVKLLLAGDGRIDEHDLAAFAAKPAQIRQLRALAPQLSPGYVPIVDELSGVNYAAHVLPYVAGDDLLGAARRAPGAGRSAREIAALLVRLTTTGYAAHPAASSGDGAALAAMARVRQRLSLIAPLIPAAAIGGPGCRVNGLPCQSLLRLFDEIAASAGIRAALAPDLLSIPVHGDLNTRNVLVGSGSGGPRFALLDPRGTLDPVDVVDDLARLVLSVSLWDSLLRNPASVTRDGRSDRDVRVTVPVYPGYADLLTRLPAVFGGTQPLADLLARSGAWRARLAFGHAVAAIDEAACRVSAARSRGVPGRDPRVLQTVQAFFFTGLLLLNDVVTRLAVAPEVDLRAHWQVLRSVHRLTTAASAGPAPRAVTRI